MPQVLAKSQIFLYTIPDRPAHPQDLVDLAGAHIVHRAPINLPTDCPTTVSSARLVELVQEIKDDWQSDGVPLDLVDISVDAMLDELANLLERAGIPHASDLI